MITPQQCRAARGALEWQIKTLAESAKLTTKTITAFESGKKTHNSTQQVIQKCLEIAGVVFDVDGRGVKWTTE